MQFPVVYFRPIQAADDASIAVIIRSSLKEFQLTGPGFACDDPELDHLSTFYASHAAAAYFVVEADGEVIGGAGIFPLKGGEAGTCELQKMYFTPNARGQGLGKELLAFLIRRAKHFGYTAMYLETSSQMVTAKKLYESSGFKCLEQPLGRTGHHGCDAWFLCQF